MRNANSTTRRALTLLGITVLVVAVAGLAMAQGPGRGMGKGHGNGQGCDMGCDGGHRMGHGMGLERMTARLELSEEQQAAIGKIHDDARAKQLERRKETMRLRNELEGELLKEQPNEKTALDLAGKIGDLRTDGQKSRLATRLAVREQLTPEQRDKMLLMNQGRGHGGRHQGHMGRGRSHGRHGGDCPLEKTES